MAYTCVFAAGEGKITRTWQFRRREGARLTITTLGTYPVLPLLEARQQALELATKGKSYSPTVDVAAEQWLSERIDHTHRKAELIRGYVDRAILPALGSRRVRDIDPSEIATVIRSYRDRVGKKAAARQGGLTAARALLGVFKGLFGYAVANGWIKQSPATQLTAAVVGPPGAARTRVLSDDEIRFVMTTDIRQGPVLRFLLATGLRIGEAYNGHRDGQYWVIPPEFSKNKREHRVPGWRSPSSSATRFTSAFLPWPLWSSSRSHFLLSASRYRNQFLIRVTTLEGNTWQSLPATCDLDSCWRAGALRWSPPL